MPNFDTIKEKIENLNTEIKQASFEMEFAKTSANKTELKIKPIYLVFLLVAVFLVELSTAVIKRKYEPNIWLYCATGAVIIVYIAYVIVTLSKQRNSQKDTNDLYSTKKTIYEALRNKRKEIFERFVAETGGVVMQSAENNFNHYIWVEDSVLIIAILEEKLDIKEIPLDNIKYISSDERLFDYNKVIGTATNVGNETPYSYIFTNEKCYLYYTKNYDELAKLMPEKELLQVLKKNNS